MIHENILGSTYIQDMESISLSMMTTASKESTSTREDILDNNKKELIGKYQTNDV
jgi:hypothetical protein